MSDLTYDHLSLAEKLEITAGWTEDPEQLEAIKRSPALESMIPALESTHSDLLSLKAQTPAELLHKDALRGWDTIHDVKSSASHEALHGIWRLTNDAGVKACIELLYPPGPAIWARSYAEEAGEARRIEANITDVHRATLSAITLPDGSTMLAHVEARLEAARKIGELSTDRAKQTAAAQPTPTEQTARGLHWRWIEVARTFVQLIHTLRIPKADADLLLARLRDLQP